MLNNNKKIFQLKIFEDKIETGLPLIQLTRSINGETGTATFIFLKSDFLSTLSDLKNLPIKKISLVSDKNIIEITDISIFFKNGQPFLIKAILILKSPKEWFDFLYFMNNYSKQAGLSFYDEQRSFLD